MTARRREDGNPGKPRGRPSAEGAAQAVAGGNGATPLVVPAEAAPPSLREIPIPLTSRAVFWQPRHAAASPTLVHLPFLFWLVETARPARVVQLGLGDGVGFMALCQALDKLSLDAVCMGLDPRPDGKPALSPRHEEERETLYGDFSFIVSEEPGIAARHMQGGEVDLLLIDMPVDDTFLAGFRAHWEPLLSERAILVLHDPAANLRTTEAMQHMERLRNARPHIGFPQAATGLDAILLGREQPDRLLRFAELGLGMPDFLAARRVFARLGQGLAKEQEAKSRLAALNKATAALKEAEARAAKLEAQLAPLRAEMEAAQAGEAEQVEVAAGLQAQVFDLTAELGETRQARDELQSLHAESTARLARRDAALAEKATELEAAVRKRDELKAQNERQRAEVHALTAQVEELRTELEAARQGSERERQLAEDCAAAAEELQSLRAESAAQIARRDAALAEKAAEIEDAARQRRELEARLERQREELRLLTARAEELANAAARKADEVAELRNSTSWRLTSPIRRLKTGLRPGTSAVAAPSDASPSTMPSLAAQVAALRASPLFDGKWYAERYPECGGPQKAAEHYLREGAFIGHDPGPSFSTTSYYDKNPDVAGSGWPALAHYLFHGKAENRSFTAK